MGNEHTAEDEPAIWRIRSLHALKRERKPYALTTYKDFSAFSVGIDYLLTGEDIDKDLLLD